MRLHHLHVGSAYLEKAASSSSSSQAVPSRTASPPFSSSSSSSAFPFGLQCLRPLAPKISLPEPKKMTAPPFEFGRARNASKLLHCTVHVPASGTTRWNPSAEQIKVLEMLYRGGMRTPNAMQIERITEELGKFGRIEGKNVFYWFQNHKARERQKQKRAALLTLSTALHDSSSSSSLPETKDAAEKKLEAWEAGASCKRRCRTWAGDGDAATTTEVADCTNDVTLELFPLHPQGKA